MDETPAKKLGLAALALAALGAPVVTTNAEAAGPATGHNDMIGAKPGQKGIVLGRDGKPMNNNFVDRADKPPQNNNNIIIGNDGRPMDNNRYVLGNDGKYHDKQRNNTIVLIGGSSGH